MGSFEVFRKAVAAAMRREAGWRHFQPDQVEVQGDDHLTDEATVRTLKATILTQPEIAAEGYIQRSRIGKGDKALMSGEWTDGEFVLKIGKASSNIFFWTIEGKITFEDPNQFPPAA